MVATYYFYDRAAVGQTSLGHTDKNNVVSNAVFNLGAGIQIDPNIPLAFSAR